MIGVYGSLLFVVGASLVIGRALFVWAANGSPPVPGVDGGWLAPGYGIAALLVIAGCASRLPGHAVTVAVVTAAALIGCALYLRGSNLAALEWRTVGLPIFAITVLAGSLPFAIAGHFGILGVGYVNDDMSSHLMIADYVRDPSGPIPSFVKGGYPTGPHGLVAGISEAGGGLVNTFSGFTLALAPLTALLSLTMLGGLRAPLRVIAGAFTALCYLGAAYLTQGAFKESLEAIIIAAFAIGLWCLIAPDAEKEPAHPARRVAPLAIVAAASVFNYSLPGLLWIAAIALSVVIARFVPTIAAAWQRREPIVAAIRADMPAGAGRAMVPYLGAGALVVALFTAQEWSRIADFARLEALNPDRFGSDLGNLRHALAPIEALGVWPSGDYKVSASGAGMPAALFYLLGALALSLLLVGMRNLWRSSRPVLPALLIGVLFVWGLSELFSTAYIAAKALAIASPFVIAIICLAVFSADAKRLTRAVGAVVLLAAALSSFLVLRQAPVGPGDHPAELAAIAPLVEGSDVLFLGRDDFIGWELRGAETITGVVLNHYNVEDAKGRFRKSEGGGEKFDIDAAHPSTLDQFDYVLTTTGGPQSQSSNLFKEVKRTENFVLYELPGTAGKRRTLDEGSEPGAVLNCQSRVGAEIATGKGSAVIWRAPPVIAEEAAWSPGATINDGAAARIELRLRPGDYLISLAYDSRRPLRIAAPELGLDRVLAANLDFRGPAPYLPVGEVSVEAGGSYAFAATTSPPNALARLLQAPNEAHLRNLSATPLGVIERIQRREACGKYVDWFRPKGESGLRIEPGVVPPRPAAPARRGGAAQSPRSSSGSQIR